MSGSELQVKPFLSSNPGQGFFAAMRGTVIEHDIKFLVGISLQQTTKKPNESFTVVTPDRLTFNLSTVNFQGGQQRGGAVALIFVTETFNLVRFHRQPRLGAINAWIEVFSSTDKTTAFSGGLRYNPITASIFGSNSGSVLLFQ